MDEKTVARFWEKVDVCDGDGCWTWNAGTNIAGYGTFRYRRSSRLSPRIAWELAKGEPPPDGMCVCHKCDNPPCVRPDHLFLGTRLDNAEDMKRKGRSNKLGPGEDHPAAKLTQVAVDEMRALFATGGFTKNALAYRYGISNVQVANIVHGKSWPHTFSQTQPQTTLPST